jgi:hypothetical protein
MEDILVPWGGRVKFPVFEFRAMFQSLIDDPRLRKELLINWKNPSSIPPYDKDYLDETHSAEWYHDTYKLYNIQDGRFVVLCGLIFFLDRTHVAGNDRQGIECLFFTLSIIPWQFRNRSWSWCPLGIMPKFKANDSKGQNATAFHHVLSVLLRGVREAHSLGGLITDLLGPDGLQQTLTFKVPICLANGDVEGNDKLCGRYASHSTKYLNRECDILMEDADNPHASCQRTSASTISNHVASNNRKELQCQGYHFLDNATNDLDFGANKHGINGCTLGEVLHQLQKGWITVTLDEFYKVVLTRVTVTIPESSF